VRLERKPHAGQPWSHRLRLLKLAPGRAYAQKCGTKKNLIATTAIGARVFQGLNLVPKSQPLPPRQYGIGKLFVRFCTILPPTFPLFSVHVGRWRGEWGLTVKRAQAVMSVLTVELDGPCVMRTSAFPFKHETPG
jgi:hypothetical protein